MLGAGFGAGKYFGWFSGKGWFARSAAETLFQPDKIKIKKLPANASEIFLAISPDGKYMVYSSIGMEGRNLYVRQLAADSSLKLLSLVNIQIWGAQFSKDGAFIYFLKEDSEKPVGGALYRIPTLGGEPQKLLERLDAFVLSPDNSQVAYRRLEPGESVVYIADFNGSVKKIAARKLPNSYGGLSWSPDGKMITIEVRNVESGGVYGAIVGLPIEGGPERLLTAERWPAVKRAIWLSDGSGFILQAKDEITQRLQFWKVSYPSGKAERIIKDNNHYHNFDLTADNSLFAMSSTLSGNLWELSLDGVNRPRKLTLGFDNYASVCYLPDGRILYSSDTVEGSHIWIMEADGSNPKQLTFGQNNNFHLSVSPVGSVVVFVSNRKGKLNLWRMELEGGELMQLTNGERDLYPAFSPDGKWIIYLSDDSGSWKICKIPTEGGAPVPVYEKASECFPAVSPDGKLISCEYVHAETKDAGILLIPVEGGPTKKISCVFSSHNVRWSKDGKGLIFVQNREGFQDFWRLPIDGGPLKQLSDLKMKDGIDYFDYSPDGKRLLYNLTIPLNEIVLITNSDSR